MRKGFAALLALSIVAFFVCTVIADNLLQIWHFDVGQADCTLLLSPSGISVLFDCGEENWNSSSNVDCVAPRITSILGRKELDYVVLSHFHADHVGYVRKGGIWGLLEKYDFSVRTVIVRDYLSYREEALSKAYDLWREYLPATQQIKLVQTASLGMTIVLDDGVSLEVCSVDGNGNINPDTDASENDFSIGVLISYGDYQEWIGGDLSGFSLGGYSDIETSAAAHIGDVEVLRVNHHGSKFSSNTTFLENLDPEVSIISVGSNNKYEHPDLDSLTRLAETSWVYLTTAGATNWNLLDCLYPIETLGDICITTDGATYTVNGKCYQAFPDTRVDTDGDGYYSEVDTDDSDPEENPKTRAQP